MKIQERNLICENPRKETLTDHRIKFPKRSKLSYCTASSLFGSKQEQEDFMLATEMQNSLNQASKVRRGSRDFPDRCISLKSHTLRGGEGGGRLSSSGKFGNLGPQFSAFWVIFCAIQTSKYIAKFSARFRKKCYVHA